jgi:ATP-dependent RNA helicase RhlE
MAVNLVSLDEEGFMQAIERYTKQDIAVEIIQEFMPEPGEKAEPIAMGRQTIWGGAGKPPSRDVMQAAAKAARTEMLTRVRESKGPGTARSGGGGRGPAPGGRGGSRGGRSGGGRNAPGGAAYGGEARSSNANDDNFGNAGAGREAEPRSHLSAAEQAVRGPGQRQARGYGGGNGGGYGGPVDAGAGPSRAGAGGQPDPMRTSVDMMADRGPRRGGFGGGNRNAGNGGGGGGGRPGGGAGRPGGNRPRNASGTRGQSGR